MSSDESLCTNTIILIHKDDTQEVIMKRIFRTLLGSLMIPAKLISKYDIYERLKTGNFTDEDIDYAFNALFVDSNYGRDNFYSVFLNNEFD